MLKKQWYILSKANAEFVCVMEDVLEVYCGKYDEKNPLICMDEASKQLVEEVRMSATPGKFLVKYMIIKSFILPT